jgi:hypothetical protein
MLASVSASFALSASSAFADPGAFESLVKQMYLRALGDATISISPEAAEQSASCYVAFVVQGFTNDELRRLDAHASGGPALGEALANKVLARLTDPQAAPACR